MCLVVVVVVEGGSTVGWGRGGLAVPFDQRLFWALSPCAPQCKTGSSNRRKIRSFSDSRASALVGGRDEVCWRRPSIRLS